MTVAGRIREPYFLQAPCLCGELRLAYGSRGLFRHYFSCCSSGGAESDHPVEAEAWLGVAPERPEQSPLLAVGVEQLAGTVLYRHLDSSRRLLYVGISDDLRARSRRHLKESRWARYVAEVQAESAGSRASAAAAEALAISSECPMFNTRHAAPGAAKLRGLYVARLRFIQGPRRHGLSLSQL